MRFYTFVLVLLFFAIPTLAQGGWTPHSATTNGDLVAVYFTSAEKGWIAGDNGYLASTTDEGKTWTRYPLNTTEDINEIYFRNDSNGYLVAGRKMFITHDSGRTWQEIQIYRTGEFGAARPEFLSIHFSDKKHGYVVGSILRRSENDDVVINSLVMRTEDGGDTWRRIEVPSKVELFHLDFDGNSRGWIVGDAGTILESTDEGNTWRRQQSGTTLPLYNVDFRNDKDGLAVGKSGTILRTENGGASWETVQTGYKDTFMQVDFADDKNIWIVGYAGTILLSSDKGRTWSKQDIGVSEHLYGLKMDKKYGWAVGAKGTVLEFRK